MDKQQITALPKKYLASRLIGYIFDWRQAKISRSEDIEIK